MGFLDSLKEKAENFDGLKGKVEDIVDDLKNNSEESKESKKNNIAADETLDLRNASKEELKQKYNEIAKEMGDSKFFTKKEFNHLPEIVQPSEEVLAFASGHMDGSTWLIVLTDRRIIFLDKGIFFKLNQETIPLNRVSAVSGSTGAIWGKIIITDAAKDRVIENVNKKTVRPFTNKVQETLDIINNNNNNSETIVKTEDNPYEKLERLADLKEKEIISEEEFKAEKQKILNK